MPRSTTSLPDGTRLTFGHDHAVGWFAEVRRRGTARVELDALSPGYDHQKPLDGVLRWISRQLASEDDLDAALRWLAEGDGPGDINELSEIQRVLMAVVIEMRRMVG